MNPAIFLFGIMFLIVQNAHFGWNGWPKSDAEVICDGITMIIFALAFVGSQR